ncbi:PIN domain-containing protein, partial [Tatumella sp. OPLPL6]|uniref:PIN domain-containing protein n=1 Tax=Tatumella sp. OPLPL6 TaxID=1928657 RepID=UPI000C659DB7
MNSEKKLNIKRIIIDSNILIRDPKLTSANIKMLVKIKDFYNIKLYIPDLVIDECLENYKKKTSEAIRDYEKALTAMQRLVMDLDKSELKNELFVTCENDLIRQYEIRLNRFIKNNEVEKIPYPTIAHKEVVKAIYECNLP